MELLFLEPIFKERIWGGVQLEKYFDYLLPSPSTGECWAISAHTHGINNITNGTFSGLGLKQLWEQHQYLFDNHTKKLFPFMIKIIDATQDLSVQVHPDNNYAQLHENDSGKFECWYVLDAKPDAKIIYGHNALTKAQLHDLIIRQQWQTLLNTIPVKTGDFFVVPPGVIHALGSGILVLEIQQSSDVTYRIYDYDRPDEAGKLRELHIDKALDVINVPHVPWVIENLDIQALSPTTGITNLTKNKYFQVQKVTVNGNIQYHIKSKYLLVNVINGNAIINGFMVTQGQHFIVPHQVKTLDINGRIEFIVTSEV